MDQQIINQLKEVFKKLTTPIELEQLKSGHQKQKELSQMLMEVADCSDLISVVESQETSVIPGFKINYNKVFNGISFLGIPGGHEFTSFILAILNSDLKGNLPDENIIQRIKNIKGPISLKTYISLECENCPEVVQSLNLISILNKNISHTMIDGALAQEQIEKLGIQGVPSVIVEEKLFLSGKNSLAQILNKLEEEFGSEVSSQEKDLGLFDVAVIGAGPAGHSAAIYSARKGLKVVIVGEKSGGQMADTKGIENLISIPYTEGATLAANLNKHSQEYNIPILEHRKVTKIIPGKIKNINLDSKETLRAKSVIIATGAQWRKLGIEGEQEYIGRGVAFCPHCDGPYYKGKDIAVVGGGNSGVEAAIDLAGIVQSVTLFEFMPELKADKVLIDKLKSLPNVSIVTNARTTKVLGDGRKVMGIEYEDREIGEIKKMNLDGIFVQIGLVPNSGFIKDIVETTANGEIVIDAKCKTNQEGIYAAGDVTTTPYKQIIISMGEGAKAALSAFEDSMREE